MNWQNVTVKLSDLQPWEHNPRTMSKRQAQRLLKSWHELGQFQTIAIGPHGEVYDGHQRLNALLAAHGGNYAIEARQCERELSDDERATLTLAANLPAGAWNWDALSAWDADVLKDWGMDAEQLQQWNNDAANLATMLESAQPETGDADADPQIDRAAELNEKWQVKRGDLWRIGEHRLLCGDSTKRDDVEMVMASQRANLCLTDPPYGLGDGKESGKNDYSGYEDTRENLQKLAALWLPIARDISDAVVFSPGVTNAWVYPEANWIMCWFYGGGQLRSSWGFNCWQPFLCYGNDPSLAHGHGGRPDAVDMNTPANEYDLDHPCPKPLKLWSWFIERLSFDVSDVLYDPFGGSGTTLVACQNLQRKCRAIEISPNYCAVILERMATAFPGIEIERIA